METWGFMHIIRAAYEREKMKSAQWNYMLSQDKSLSKQWREYFVVASWLALFELAEFRGRDD